MPVVASAADHPEYAREKPDRHNDHRTEREIAERPLDYAEPEFGDTLHQHLDVHEHILRLYFERRHHDADDDRENGQPDGDGERVAAKNLIFVHASAPVSLIHSSDRLAQLHR